MAYNGESETAVQALVLSILTEHINPYPLWTVSVFEPRATWTTRPHLPVLESATAALVQPFPGMPVERVAQTFEPQI